MAAKKKTVTPLQGGGVTAQQGPAVVKKSTRKRKELSVVFRLRSGQTTGEIKRQLQIRLTADHGGIETPKPETDFGSGLFVRPDQWDSSIQRIKGRSKEAAEVNEQIAQLELDIRDVWRKLKDKYKEGLGPKPTGLLLKQEIQSPGTADPLVLDFFQVFLNYKDSLDGTEEGQSEKTATAYYKAKGHLRAFLCHEEGKPVDQLPVLRLSHVTAGHAKRFHAWLQIKPETGQRRMLKDSANKHLSIFRHCIEYALDNGLLTRNPLDRFRPKRGKTKPVASLNAAQVIQLEQYKTDDQQLSVILWWVRLMCYTGLDYTDAIRYACDRQEYETDETGGNGRKIVMERSKPPRNTCEIPVSVKIDHLFQEYPQGPTAPNLADVNRHLKKIVGPQIGFKDKFTSKICRKTAGSIWLLDGYSMEGVSRFLGHSSTRVTEQHYVKVTSDFVNKEMDRVNKLRSD